MQLKRPLRSSSRRAQHRQDLPTIAPTQRERNRRANVNEDAALYRCDCGYAFTAAVTTSVPCPHCGSSQAW